MALTYVHNVLLNYF